MKKDDLEKFKPVFDRFINEHNILLRAPIGFPLTFTNTMNEPYSAELAYAGIYSDILISPLTGDNIVEKIKEYFSFINNIFNCLKIPFPMEITDKRAVFIKLNDHFESLHDIDVYEIKYETPKYFISVKEDLSDQVTDNTTYMTFDLNINFKDTPSYYEHSVKTVYGKSNIHGNAKNVKVYKIKHTHISMTINFNHVDDFLLLFLTAHKNKLSKEIGCKTVRIEKEHVELFKMLMF